jgi:hypothetical protein
VSTSESIQKPIVWNYHANKGSVKVRYHWNTTLFHYICSCTLWNTETPSEAGQGRKKASGAKSIERAILELRAGRRSNSRWLNAVASRCLIAMLLLLPPTSRVDRRPGYSPRFQTTYKPEAMTRSEAGTKLRLLDRTLNVRLAGFF